MTQRTGRRWYCISMWAEDYFSVANEWVTPVTAAISAAAGVTAGWLTGRQALLREREGRDQQRREKAYLELLFAMEARRKAAMARLADDTYRPTPPPTREPAEDARLRALLAVFGSATIRNDLYPKWAAIVQDIENLAEAPGPDINQFKVRRIRLAEASRRAYDDVARQISRELGVEPEQPRKRTMRFRIK